MVSTEFSCLEKQIVSDKSTIETNQNEETGKAPAREKKTALNPLWVADGNLFVWKS